MKKITFSAIGALVLCLLSSPLWAEDHPHVAALRSLSINRSLLAKSESEYRALLDEEQKNPSDNLTQRLSSLRYKIQALKDDAQRLQSELPGNLSASEFLKEIILRQTEPGRSQRSVDPAHEEKIDEKVSSIYRLHEEALSYIADKRYDQAEKAYQEIILLSPDDEEAYLLLGHTCLAAGHYEKAGQAFRNAIHINPANEKEIPRLYENILVENPSDDEALTQLGFSQLLLGDAEKARLSFEEAIQLNPSSAAAKQGLAELRG